MKENCFGETLKEILIHFSLADRFRDDKTANLAQAHKAIIELIKTELVPQEKPEGKHDGHENDANSWCYSCNKSDDEKEFTHNWHWNKCRTEILSKLEGAL